MLQRLSKSLFSDLIEKVRLHTFHIVRVLTSTALHSKFIPILLKKTFKWPHIVSGCCIYSWKVNGRLTFFSPLEITKDAQCTFEVVLTPSAYSNTAGNLMVEQIMQRPKMWPKHQFNWHRASNLQILVWIQDIPNLYNPNNILVALCIGHHYTFIFLQIIIEQHWAYSRLASGNNGLVIREVFVTILYDDLHNACCTDSRDTFLESWH